MILNSHKSHVKKHVKHHVKECTYIDKDHSISRKIKNTDLLFDGCVYTDASVVNKSAGIGIWSEYYNINNSWALKGLIDVNRAELGAILIALISLNYTGNVNILSDSLTSLKLISGSIDLAKFSLITHCIQYMKSNWQGDLHFRKVKGHSGNIGNEHADSLAYEGVMYIRKKHIYLPDDIFGKENRDYDLKHIVDTTKIINDL